MLLKCRSDAVDSRDACVTNNYAQMHDQQQQYENKEHVPLNFMKLKLTSRSISE